MDGGVEEVEDGRINLTDISELTDLEARINNNSAFHISIVQH